MVKKTANPIMDVPVRLLTGLAAIMVVVLGVEIIAFLDQRREKKLAKNK